MNQSEVSISIGIRSDTPNMVTLVIATDTGWSMVQTWLPDHARNIGAALMDCANEVDMGEYRQDTEHPVDRLIREINTGIEEDSAAQAEEELDGPYSTENVDATVMPPNGESRADGPMFGTEGQKLYALRIGRMYWSTYADSPQAAFKKACEAFPESSTEPVITHVDGEEQ